MAKYQLRSNWKRFEELEEETRKDIIEMWRQAALTNISGYDHERLVDRVATSLWCFNVPGDIRELANELAGGYCQDRVNHSAGFKFWLLMDAVKMSKEFIYDENNIHNHMNLEWVEAALEEVEE